MTRKTVATLYPEVRNVDGVQTPHYEGEHVVLTGPVVGTVETSDGTRYDVTPNVIAIDPDHAGEVTHLIGVALEEQGHPAHKDPAVPFVHYCTDACGELARDVTHPTQALAAARTATQVDGIEDAHVRRAVAVALGFDDPGDPGPQMARASTAAENASLNGLDGTGSTNVIPDVSLHVGDPGTTGANENANAGSYARLPCSWNAAASGSKTNSSSLAFTTAGSVAVTHFGTWSSATYGAGTYALGGALGSSVTAVNITVAPGAITLSAS